MNPETIKNPEKEKTWERTSVTGLLRHRSGRYYGRLSVAGKDKFVSMKTDLMETARKRFSEEKAKHERVRKAVRKSGNGVGNMGDLLAIYRATIANQAKAEMSESRKTRLLQHTRYIEKTWPEFIKLHPSEINAASIGKWRSHALSQGSGYRPPGAKNSETRGKSPFTFNAALDVVRHLLDIAVDNHSIHANPIAGRRKLKASYKPKKADLPSRTTIQAIFDAIESGKERGGWPLETADFCRFLALTGCRQGEARRVKWRHVDLEKGTLHVRGTKSDNSDRRIPLIPAAHALISKIKERRLVSPTVAIDGVPTVDPEAPVLAVFEAQKSLDRACETVGAPRITHHDLRDAFATSCIEAGVDIPTVAGWLGHSDGGALLMKTYNHLRDEHSKAMASKVQFGGAS